MDMLATPEFWIGLLKIIWINIILSGDNAVVIALAARTLPARQQRQAILWGTLAAVLLRVLLTVVAARLLQLPYLQIVGGLLLLWIGVQLLADDDDAQDEVKHSGNLMSAIRTILVADLVMSLDNVIGVAAAAGGNTVLLVVGLAIAIPIVVFGSTLMIRLMERFPVIVTIGAGLIGWVAGEAIASDQVLQAWFVPHSAPFYGAAALGAVLVVVIGRRMQHARQHANQSSPRGSA